MYFYTSAIARAFDFAIYMDLYFPNQYPFCLHPGTKWQRAWPSIRPFGPLDPCSGHPCLLRPKAIHQESIHRSNSYLRLRLWHSFIPLCIRPSVDVAVYPSLRSFRHLLIPLCFHSVRLPIYQPVYLSSYPPFLAFSCLFIHHLSVYAIIHQHILRSSSAYNALYSSTNKPFILQLTHLIHRLLTYFIHLLTTKVIHLLTTFHVSTYNAFHPSTCNIPYPFTDNTFAFPPSTYKHTASTYPPTRSPHLSLHPPPINSGLYSSTARPPIPPHPASSVPN